MGASLMLIVMTAEQEILFRQFAAECPGAIRMEWESVDIDVINSKRILCLQPCWKPSQVGPIYVHYHPRGCTEAEMQALTDRHGQTDFMTLDND